MSFFLPKAAIDQHIAILGKTGSGKTFTAKLIVEHVLNQNRQVCVLDPTGAWFGLRLAADGKHAGLDIVLLGGEHADIPLAERSGAAVARLVTEQGASVVIDTSGFTVGEYTRWFIDFAGTLYTTLRNPLHLIIDEAHYFMPQGRVPDPDAGRMLHAGNRLMSGGRSRGIRGLMITQRPAKLHKDALTCADTLIAMRVIAPQDRQAVKDWVDGCGNAEDGKRVLDSLAQLKRGEGWVWYPEGAHLERVEFPPIATYDSSAAPKHGSKAVKVAEINLTEVRASLAEAVKEAEANDPKLLRKRIAELEKQLRDRPAETKTVEVKVEVPVLKNGQLDRTEKVIERLAAIAEKVGSEASELRRMIAPATRPAPVLARPVPVARPAAAVSKPVSTIPKIVPADGEPLTINKTQQRILDAMAWYESLGTMEPTLTQIGAVALIDTSGGHFSNNVGPLSTHGLVERGHGSLRLTDAGRELSNKPGSIGTLADYHDVLRQRVRKMRSASGKTIEMLDVIIAAGGQPVTVEQIGQALNIDHTGGHFSNCIGPLSTVGLITRRSGIVQPTDVLFPLGF